MNDRKFKIGDRVEGTLLLSDRKVTGTLFFIDEGSKIPYQVTCDDDGTGVGGLSLWVNTEDLKLVQEEKEVSNKRYKIGDYVRTDGGGYHDTKHTGVIKGYYNCDDGEDNFLYEIMLDGRYTTLTFYPYEVLGLVDEPSNNKAQKPTTQNNKKPQAKPRAYIVHRHLPNNEYKIEGVYTTREGALRRKGRVAKETKTKLKDVYITKHVYQGVVK